MKVIRRKFASFLIVAMTASSVNATQNDFESLDLDRGILVNSDSSTPGRTTLRELLDTNGYRRITLRSIELSRFMLTEFSEILRRDALMLDEFPLRRISRSFDPPIMIFHFRGDFSIASQVESGEVTALLSTPPDIAEGAEPLGRAELVAIVRRLANAAGVLLPGYEFKESVISSSIDQSVSVSYMACLPGSEIRLNVGLSGNFDKYTGMPTHAQFSREVQLYETPFRDWMSREEGYHRTIAAAYDQIPWPTYRVFVQTASLDIPDYGEHQISMSPRHQRLILEKKQCLVSAAVISPVAEPGEVTESINVVFDAQTRELLAIFPGLGPQHVGVPGAKVLRGNLLIENQMIGLPDGSLKIPLRRVKDAHVSAENMVQVAFRQDKLTFAAELDPSSQLLWFEGRAYKSTRAFTAGLMKTFSRK